MYFIKKNFSRINIKNTLFFNYFFFLQNQGLSPLSREIRVTVIVKDMNNLRPVFEGLDKHLSNSYRGSVPENEPVYREVINVRAVDGDHDPPNNVVSGITFCVTAKLIYPKIAMPVLKCLIF